ncbi:vesicle-associated membrane protein 8-like [Thalassophryne amazonica]|uniref:vesicle-associated membrane protein 8-like n=1 Tax=Thalassophryne amazonica TaxID=390379 RepID=UPI001471C47D|nr:vesicle-associated membrane protein 8-like [Thalassophryne amazonica]
MGKIAWWPVKDQDGEEPQGSLQGIHFQLDEVTDQMKKNLKKILQVENNLHDLLDTSEKMDIEAKKLRQKSNEVARSCWWKNIKLVEAIVVVALIIVLIIILLATGVIPVNASVLPITATTTP